MIETTDHPASTHTRTRFETKLARKGWVSSPCAARGCRKSNYIGGLCYQHQAIVSNDVAHDLQAAGLDWDASHLQVSVNEALYVTATDTRASRAEYHLVHRLAMASILGRPLRAGENVHHVNGCRWDNEPRNLELWVTAQPSGQRPGDLAHYARRLLARYGTAAERSLFEAHQ